jgi:hypothetical protein
MIANINYDYQGCKNNTLDSSNDEGADARMQNKKEDYIYI